MVKKKSQKNASQDYLRKARSLAKLGESFDAADMFLKAGKPLHAAGMYIKEGLIDEGIEIARQAGDYKAAAKFAQNAASQWEKEGNSDLASEYMFLAADNYQVIGMRDQAARLRKKAISITHELNRQFYRGDYGSNRGNQGKKSRLEQSMVSASLAILLFVGGIFFLISNFSNSNIQLSPGATFFNWRLWSGIVLLIAGLIFGIIYFRKRK